jgi:hypothetical protein
MGEGFRQGGTYAIVWRAIGGLAIVIGSFYATLKVMDYRESSTLPRNAAPTGLITIEEATYGANCSRGIKAGNVTQYAAKACDGRLACNIAISVQELGDPAQGCGKDYSLSFKCGQQQLSRKMHVDGEANGARLALDCERPP